MKPSTLKNKKPRRSRTKKLSLKKTFFVYILKCADESLYVGSTNNIQKRLYQHNHLKSGAHYTKIRRPVTLVHKEKLKTYAKARAREAALKRLTREKKLELLNTNSV